MGLKLTVSIPSSNVAQFWFPIPTSLLKTLRFNSLNKMKSVLLLMDKVGLHEAGSSPLTLTRVGGESKAFSIETALRDVHLSGT